MRAAESMEGVVLNFKEWRRVKAELEIYPASVDFGQHPCVLRTLQKMELIEALPGKRKSFWLSGDVVDLIVDNINASVALNRQPVALGEELHEIQGPQYPDMHHGVAFSTWSGTLDSKREKLAESLKITLTQSRDIQHERVDVKY